jgi:membrane-associated protease RseP (regulator of RpoE activity)
MSDEAPRADDSPDPIASAPAIAPRSGILLPRWLGFAAGAVVVAVVFGVIGYAIGDSSGSGSRSRSAPGGIQIQVPGRIGPGGSMSIGPLPRNLVPGLEGGGLSVPGPVPANPLLGVQVTETKGGVLITGVQSGSPAADSGLQRGDVITAVDGTSVASARDLVLIVGRHMSGDQISITYTRNGTSSTANITLSAALASQGI